MHQERNDALKDNNKLALQRYNFAISCLFSGEKVMDLGCGMGYGSYLIQKAGFEVRGIDNSEEAIEYAKKNYMSCRFDVDDLEKTAYWGSDVAVCLEVLCHLKDPKKFIDHILVDKLIISSPIDPDPNDGYKWRLHNLSEVQFKELLKDWKIIKEFRQKKYLTIYCIKI